MNPFDAALANELYRKHEHEIYTQTDRLFAGLMTVQWMAGVAAAYWISPRAWAGASSATHVHVWAAIYLGGLITLLPVLLALTRPGKPSTRYVIATTQMLMSSLLIHFTGGRIETHFHVFGSLAFLSFYREWRVLVPATVVVALDHFLRGMFWPQSVYGILTPSNWRWLEHAGWVVFEDIFLVLSCLRGKAEMRNIAERTAALHDSEGRYRAIVERAEGIFLAEAGSKKLVECNGSFQNLLGYTASEIESLTIYDFDAAPAADVDRTIREFMASRRPVNTDRRYRRKDGTEIDVTLNLSLLASGHGQTLCAAVRDVTDHRRAQESLRQTEEQLRQAYKMEAVGQLAGGIAHDFNNLLTAILGYSEILETELGPKHPLASDVAEISRAGKTASSLTRQLLTFSRRQVLQPTVLSLNSVISSVDKMLRRLIGEHIDLSVNLTPDLRKTTADPGQLEQVIINLALNARDAMRAGGRLTITTANVDLPIDNPYAIATHTCVALTVSDTGCGMPDHVRAHIFEPFFTTKEPGKGTGLGLSTVYGIVKQSGGAITVDSTPGHGSSFRIILPCVEQPAVANMPPAEASSAGAPAGETLLLVEDEAAVRFLAKRALQLAGYSVIDAPGPEEALQIAAEHDGVIDLILTDVVMPKMNGRVLAERLLVKHPEAKVLFMSGYADDALAPHGVVSEEIALLQKPFSLTALTSRVREILDSPGSSARVA